MTNNGWISLNCNRLDNEPANLILSVVRKVGDPIIDSISPPLPPLNASSSSTAKQEAKVWLHYFGGRDSIEASFNVAQVVKKSTGVYTVIFSRPFRTNRYAVVASSTAGFARISVNEPNSVDVLSHTSDGKLFDSQIFVVKEANSCCS